MNELSPGYFSSKNTPAVARSLLGKLLVRRLRGKETHYMITEVEAYDGPHDRASHASRGRTPRNAVMFSPPGHWYVYLIYGMHEMANIVTGPEGYPAAVLIRGVEGIGGPGRVTRTLAITRRHSGICARRKSGLYIADAGIRPARREIRATPRIGIHYAGPDWAGKKYRFLYARNT